MVFSFHFSSVYFWFTKFFKIFLYFNEREVEKKTMYEHEHKYPVKLSNIFTQNTYIVKFPLY